MTASHHQIEIRKDGPFYRVKVASGGAVPASFNKPSTYTAHHLAANTASLLSEMTGWPVIDHTKGQR